MEGLVAQDPQTTNLVLPIPFGTCPGCFTIQNDPKSAVNGAGGGGGGDEMAKKKPLHAVTVDPETLRV